MGNQIYFKIAGKKKKLIAGSNRQTQFWKRTFDRLCKLEKRGDEI
jgi:hypothetical protein